MGREHGLAIADALFIDQCGQVVPDRRGEFGLCVEQRQHAQVGGEFAGMGVEGLAGHAQRCRLPTQSGETIPERRLIGISRTYAHAREQSNTK